MSKKIVKLAIKPTTYAKIGNNKSNPMSEVSHLVDMCKVKLDDLNESEFVSYVYEIQKQKERVTESLEAVCSVSIFKDCPDDFCSRKFLGKIGKCTPKNIKKMDIFRDVYPQQEEKIKQRLTSTIQNLKQLQRDL
jgi:hypothetical protein